MGGEPSIANKPKENDMAGKPNDKWMESMIEKHGSAEAVREHMKSIGAKGGRNGNTGGFAARPDISKTAGSVGGSRSKKGYRLLGEVEGGLEYLHKASGIKVVFKTNQLDR